MNLLSIFFFVIYLLICWAVSALGSNRKIGSTAIFLISFFLSPLIGVIAAAISSEVPQENHVEKWKEFANIADRKVFKEDYAGAIDSYKDARYELSILKKLNKKQLAQRDAITQKYHDKIEELERKKSES